MCALFSRSFFSVFIFAMEFADDKEWNHSHIVNNISLPSRVDNEFMVNRTSTVLSIPHTLLSTSKRQKSLHFVWYLAVFISLIWRLKTHQQWRSEWTSESACQPEINHLVSILHWSLISISPAYLAEHISFAVLGDVVGDLEVSMGSCNQDKYEGRDDSSYQFHSKVF